MTKSSLRPMLATLVKKPFDNKDWVYETKWDGFRIIAVLDPRKKPVLYSRNLIDVSAKYPSLCRALGKIKAKAVFDGEMVALDKRGRSRFQLLQNYAETRAPLRYVVFDLLFAGGRDLRKLPLLERKETLRKLLPRDSSLLYSEHVVQAGIALFKQAKKKGLEGVIAKRAAGRYYSGKRTREWLKFKAVLEQEVVIVGFTKPRRSRKYFGSLVLAVYDKERRRFVYAGRAGTGFDDISLKAIYAKLLPLRSAKPIAERVPDEASTSWVRPVLVGEVQFTEWTSAGEMRHPAFLGLRSDKKPRDVVREEPS